MKMQNHACQDLFGILIEMPTYSQPYEKDRPIAVEISDDFLKVTLQDGRVIATPLDWYPRLKEVSGEELAVMELGFSGIHWPLLDEDLSVRGMLTGNRPPKSQIVAKQEV